MMITEIRERVVQFLAGDNPMRMIFLGMSRRERELWFAPTNYVDLGHLTADWLEGKIRSQPGYSAYCGPDPETMGLIPVLARINRLGLVTDMSQPGEDVRDEDVQEPWPPHHQQRACIEGWCNVDMANRLRKLAEKHGLHYIARRPAARRRYDYHRAVYVTRGIYDCGDVTNFTGVGGTPPVHEIGATRFGECNPSMQGVLATGWVVSLIDLEWGNNERLWAALEEL